MTVFRHGKCTTAHLQAMLDQQPPCPKAPGPELYIQICVCLCVLDCGLGVDRLCDDSGWALCIADLSVGLSTGHIKSGAPARCVCFDSFTHGKCTAARLQGVCELTALRMVNAQLRTCKLCWTRSPHARCCMSVCESLRLLGDRLQHRERWCCARP